MANDPEEKSPESDPPPVASLGALRAAFARMLGSDQAAESPGSENPGDSGAPPEVDVRAPEPSSGEISPLAILEGMLFVGHPDNEPLTAKLLAAIMRGVSPQEVGQLVEDLNRRYQQQERPFHIVSDGEGYRLALRPELEVLRQRMLGRIRHARLSQAAVDVLAIVAYEQPVDRDTVDAMRGRSSQAILRSLVQRELVCVEKREDDPRTRWYRTTERFLDLFGLDDLDQLPRGRDLERPV